MNDAAKQKYVFCLKDGARWAVLVVVLLLVGCSSEPAHYEGAFSASQQVKGNSESISAPIDMAWGAVLEILSQQGFLIQQADAKSHIILANREMRSKEDKDLSHTVSATVTLLPSSDQLTRVMVAANQTTELHKKSYTWWHLLWIIPVFPTGTEYTTVVVERDTVRSPQFYNDFFGAVKKSCEEKKGPGQSAPAS
ncbi:MAG: hypothetical protein Q8L74_04065 [Nitrospirota bacterium]|nr:hypothetical protein [Nitrospirota bacterium]MDP2384517.1 hypothetical protein [Nitrospirota bacterium]MDP3596362.1 hypothetical protein [Nitrospirota bacterium]